MSRRRIRLCSLHRSFFDEEACKTMLESRKIDLDDGRPWKRRKLDPDDDGWAALIEFNVECHFLEESSASSSSAAIELDTSPLEVSITFDDPILTVSNPITDESLFAFVCQEAEVQYIEKIMWFQRLVHKDPSISRCIRLSSSVYMRQRHQTIQGSTVSFRVDVRFDKNLLQVAKLSPKDRVAILDYAFDKPYTEVNADHFYGNIGKLPKNYVHSENEKSLQHPSITCRLFPFQKRAVAWMLRREGVPLQVNSDTMIDESELPPLWETARDIDGRVLYLNRHQGFSTLDHTWISDTFKEQTILGGILAEVCTSCRIKANHLTESRKWDLGKRLRLLTSYSCTLDRLGMTLIQSQRVIRNSHRVKPQ